ncbi:magnesium transporter [Ectothiorhodospira mobilis]|uniref:Magnesium transporter MgtE n=1 Tax=Ectothiorhodospira mobilis TaxID=195064 RepID=A0A1I4RYK0_ECTMO|nr:magnesium transporter [Ectothiorhodospira mobilis]SFM57372.1 magnesium transporter [Ectothiorhodospira mobilis]
MTHAKNDHLTIPIDALRDALRRNKHKRARRILRTMHPAKVASLLETLDADQRIAAWHQIDKRFEHKVLAHLSPALQAQLTHETEAGVQGEVPDGLSGEQGEAPDGLSSEQTAADDDSGDSPETQLKLVLEALENGKLKHIAQLFNKLHPARIAGLLESLPASERAAAWGMLDHERTGKVLRYLHEGVRRRLAEEMELDDLVDAARGLEPDDLVDLIQELPPKLGREILFTLNRRERERVESLLSYDEDSAGGLMNPDHIAVRADIKVGTLLRYLRLLEDLPPNTDKFFIVDRDNRYQGIVRARRVLTTRPETTITELMETDFEPVQAEQPSEEIARRFEDHDLISVPVVDGDGHLLGRITVDDVVDVIREQAERSIMGMAGLHEETDMFAPVWASSRRRAVWLGINLLTAFLAAGVIGLFEATLEQVVALAVLMPIVASMGGIAGSQTLTLVIRGLATGQLGSGNTRILLLKEIGIGLLNGLLWALVVAALAVLWFGNWTIGTIIAAAILLNLLCAALAGVMIPMIMRKLRIDPALAGSVVLTTVTDVVGFFAFLGLATLILL